MKVFENIFKRSVKIDGNFIEIVDNAFHVKSSQTAEVFSEKWTKYNRFESKEKLFKMQKGWYLKLYGFKSEKNLAEFLSQKKYIFDAGCGLGYKAKWFADLAPNSIVIGMDISDSCKIAAENYKETPNLFFMQGDIANTPFNENTIDYVNCDQTLMHTDNPEKTFEHLSKITSKSGEFACYVYRKKALPRELLDEYFREYCKKMSKKELWDMSEKLTILGKTLSELNVKINVPDIPQLGIKGGVYDIQRFIYWNFIKCFWNEDLGWETSVITNFDWYSPSNAKRYSKEEFLNMIKRNNLQIVYFHEEESCYSGRFKKI